MLIRNIYLLVLKIRIRKDERKEVVVVEVAAAGMTGGVRGRRGLRRNH